MREDDSRMGLKALRGVQVDCALSVLALNTAAPTGNQPGRTLKDLSNIPRLLTANTGACLTARWDKAARSERWWRTASQPHFCLWKTTTKYITIAPFCEKYRET